MWRTGPFLIEVLVLLVVVVVVVIVVLVVVVQGVPLKSTPHKLSKSPALYEI